MMWFVADLLRPRLPASASPFFCFFSFRTSCMICPDPELSGPLSSIMFRAFSVLLFISSLLFPLALRVRFDCFFRRCLNSERSVGSSMMRFWSPIRSGLSGKCHSKSVQCFPGRASFLRFRMAQSRSVMSPTVLRSLQSTVWKPNPTGSCTRMNLHWAESARPMEAAGPNPLGLFSWSWRRMGALSVLDTEGRPEEGEGEGGRWWCCWCWCWCCW
mmetsp:Transcript_18070/g.44280  ORF Transcript_18070/g.44280 Transcript_18070/m.44280 type:complete len:215 (+) Transcript_18070:5278-5922(+)